MLSLLSQKQRTQTVVLYQQCNKLCKSRLLGRCIRGFATSADKTKKELVCFTRHATNPRIGVLTLNSPETYNALTPEMGNQFQTKVREIQDTLQDPTTSTGAEGLPTIQALILVGKGRAFSSGGNLAWLHSLSDNPIHVNVDTMMSFYNSYLCIRNLSIPIIGAIHGPAVGAGACLACACDFRVMGPKGALGFNFLSLGE